jgi:FkbM family methyltransferase
MPDVYTDPADVEWRFVGILRDPNTVPYEYTFTLPRPLADWDVWDYWERERVHSMRDHLKHGDVLFDVGAEHGWCSLIYASMVGPENMVLIEPTREFWPNIRHTWMKNYPCPPRACYDGLFSSVTDEERTAFPVWPAHSDGLLIGNNKYEYIHQHDQSIKQITIDDYVAWTGIVPDALTIDVEGAELCVLQGAHDTLVAHHPQIWVSIHPDLMERDYGDLPHELYGYLGRRGYTGTHLATDHEQHWHFHLEQD